MSETGEMSTMSGATVDARVLGQFLVMQAVIGSLPDATIMPFVVQGLADIPGIDNVAFHPEGGTNRANALPLTRLPLETHGASFGELSFLVTDKAAFAPYAEYLHNFTFMLALILEERGQRRIIENHKKQLEQQVAQRSAELTRERDAANRYLNIADVMLMALDSQGRIAMINRKGAQLLGRPEVDLLGMDWFDNFVPTAQRSSVRQVFERLMSGESQLLERYANDIVNASGQVLLLAWNNSLLRDEAGNIVGALSSAEDITERNRIEIELAQRDEILRDILETSLDGFWRFDSQGRLVEVNPTYCQQSGYSHEELLGLSIADIEANESGTETAMHIRRVIETGHHQFETRHRRKDGSIWDVEVSATYRAAAGGLLCAFLRDITERKQVQEVIENRLLVLTQPMEGSTIAFDELFNRDEIQRIQDEFALATGVASIITQPDGTPITAPSNFTHLCSEIIRKTEKGCSNCFKSDAAIGCYNPDGPIVQPCLSGGLWDAGASITLDGHHIANWLIGQVRDETQTVEAMRAYAKEIGADETLFMKAFHDVPAMSREHFENIASALFTLAHQLSHSAYQNIQQARHITERKRAEARVKRQAQRAEALLQLPRLAEEFDEQAFMQHSLTLAEDLTGSQVSFMHFVNNDEETIELVAWSQKTIAHYCQASFDRHYPVSSAGIWADAVRHRGPVTCNDYASYPGKMGLPHGHAQLIRFVSVPVIEDGKVVMLTGVGNSASAYDEFDLESVQLLSNDIWHIVQRRRDQQNLMQQKALLETRVAQRTEALAAASKAAETANIAKSAFLANMSHEIRTPMNGIVGMANAMRREGVTPQQGKRLDTIDASAKHLLSVINDILDISKIEAGKFELEVMPVVVSSLLANVSSILAERAKAKGIHLLIETGHLPHSLLGDPTRLQQALLNYATNAVKFTEQGSVTLRALLQKETDDSVILRFEVQDTGIGIEPEAMPRLFRAFEQADNSMTRKYGGTGLGLVITRRLAELMGGEAGADSTPGVGSTFWFTMKLKKGNEAVAPTATTVNAEAEIRRRYADQRILVVDDEPINREIAMMQLELVVLVVDEAKDGAEAVALAQKINYAAIFMDMQMPILNGLDATRQIRELPGYRDIPIIAMTANAFAEDKAECLAAGMNDFLIKPFNPDDLFAVLLRSLSRSEG
jgi:PAS domain S-box-containing protein